MDHRLAFVIVPDNGMNAIERTAQLLSPYQSSSLQAPARKFRYKRVGGWFDGLINGKEGAERWSTVLNMLFSGERSSSENGILETSEQIEAQSSATMPRRLRVSGGEHPAPSSSPRRVNGSSIPRRTTSRSPLRLGRRIQRQTNSGPPSGTRLWTRDVDHLAVAWDISWEFIGTNLQPRTGQRGRLTWEIRQQHAATKIR